MKPIENAWNGLVQRKLLPLAILLLAAIVAIPFLLSKDPEPLAAAPASPVAAAASEDSIAKPVVSQVDDGTPAGPAAATPAATPAPAGGPSVPTTTATVPGAK